MECTLVREQDLHQPEYVYLPDILKDGYVRHRHFPADTPGSIVSIFSLFLYSCGFSCFPRTLVKIEI